MIQILKNLSKSRLFWLFLGIKAFLFVVFSHFVLQNYLMLQPCEQCVYIRYAFIILGFGCCIIAIYPRSLLGCFGVAICAYGITKGILSALILVKIQKALQSETFVFGLKGCSLSPSFDFNLPLDIWFPSLFAPKGFCGIDVPMLHETIKLSFLQEQLIDFYSDGWYLVPALKFGSMAECSLFIFVCYSVGIIILFFAIFLQLLKGQIKFN